MRHHRSIRTVLALSCFALASCSDEPTQPSSAADQLPSIPQLAVTSNTWITRADMPGIERSFLTATTVTNSTGQSILYAIGGRSTTGAPLDKVMAYNVSTDVWTVKAPLPIPLWDLNQAAVYGGKIYVSGGCAYTACVYEQPSRKLFMYNPATNTWTRKQDMPSLLQNSSGEFLYTGTSGISGVIAGKLYTLTKCYIGEAPVFDECARSLFFRYDAATNQWTVLPRPTATYTAGGVIDGKFYVAGQKVDPYTGQATMRTEVYDPATNQWTRKAPAPAPVGNVGVVLLGKLYTVGGPTTYVYDPASNTWTTKAPIPHARGVTAASKVFLNGQPRIEAVGGPRPGNNLQYIP
jgi:hypothetical protein